MAAPTVATLPPVPAEPLVGPDGVVSRLWYQFFIALWQRTGGQAGSQSAQLDLIGNTQGGMLARFAQAWLEFIATTPNSIPVLGPNVDVDLKTISQLLDLLGQVQVGSLLYRGSAGWTTLPPVNATNLFLMTQGLGQQPAWSVIPAGSQIPATIALGLTATGTNQATALALTRQWSTITTVASGTGVLVPPIATGTQATIWNDDATNDLLIYPLTGMQIDALGTNNPYTLPAGKSQIIDKLSPTSLRTQQLG